MVVLPVLGRCPACGWEGSSDDQLVACPSCGDGGVVSDGGDELVLESIELART